MKATLLCLLILAIPSAGWTRMIEVEAVAALTDLSDAAVEVAFKDAVRTCVRRATMLGLVWIRFQRAIVVGDRLTVQMIGSDEDDADDEAVPAPEWASTSQVL
jgi:hypothetical protein